MLKHSILLPFVFRLSLSYVTFDWNGQNTIGHFSTDKFIPFFFNIKLLPPMKRGVDYGFKPKVSIS
jgi:hypothetical protein